MLKSVLGARATLLFAVLLVSCTKTSDIKVSQEGSKFVITNSSSAKTFSVNFSCYDKDRDIVADAVLKPDSTFYPVLSAFSGNPSSIDTDDTSGYKRAQNVRFQAFEGYQQAQAVLTPEEEITFKAAEAKFETERSSSIAKLGDDARRESALAQSYGREARELALVNSTVSSPYGVDISRDIGAQRNEAQNNKRAADQNRAGALGDINRLRSQQLDPLQFADQKNPKRLAARAALKEAEDALRRFDDDFCDAVVLRRVVKIVPSAGT